MPCRARVLVLIAYAVLWYIFKPETFEWHAVAMLATWGMTLVIQRAEHRDTQAIHAKLDEMLHVMGDARNELTRVDEQEPEEIEERRSRMRRGVPLAIPAEPETILIVKTASLSKLSRTSLGRALLYLR
jgi:low affinity Fe/Cu permease